MRRWKVSRPHNSDGIASSRGKQRLRRRMHEDYRVGSGTPSSAIRTWLDAFRIQHRRDPSDTENIYYIESRFPKLVKEVYDQEHYAGGQGQMPLVGGYGFEAHGQQRKDRKSHIVGRGR